MKQKDKKNGNTGIHPKLRVRKTNAAHNNRANTNADANYEKEYGVRLDSLIEGFQVISFDYRYLYVNDAIVRQSKYSREELLGYTMMEKYPGIEQTNFFEVLRQCMVERTSTHLENQFTFPTGETEWFDLCIHPIPDGVYILSVEITARKNEELERHQYIRDLEQMIFMTSHKVRQPVANILGISNLLNGKHSTVEDVEKMACYMKESAARLDLFTRELTSFIDELKQRRR